MHKILITFLISSSSFFLNAHAEDLILINGNIYTVNDKQPWAEAMVISEGVIEYVGDTERAKEYLNMEIELVDLEGKLVLPGFHDVHMHPLEVYAQPQSVCLLKGGAGISAHLSRLESCMPAQRNDDWFLGWGYWIDEIIDSEVMPKALLDDLIDDKPAVIFSLSSHSNWINTAALEKMGWNADTPDPPGGVIIKNEQTGEPTGIVMDTAADMVNELIYAPTEKTLENSYYGLFNAMEDISSNGITSIADARVFWTQKHHEIWQRAEREGILKARVVLHLWAYPQIDDSQLEILKSLYSSDPDSLLKINGIKTYVDGLIGNTTAAMKTPYAVNFGFSEKNVGLNYFDQTRLTKYIAELSAVGFNFMIHAIGDRGVHESLNAIEAAMQLKDNHKNTRHRITHIDLIDNVDLARFKQLGVIADFQLASDWTFPHEYNPYASIFIDKRVKYVYRIRDIFEDGAIVTLSSDFDVSSMNPFNGIQNSITRGKQSLPSLKAAIQAYTLNGAYALDQDDITGSLEVGKYADLIVLDQNIFEIPKDEINKTTVLWTLLEGEEMFRHPDW